MSISQEEWNKLKANEIYGMYVKLDKRIENLERQTELLMQKLG